jgi:outer membrane protein TolC
MRKIALSFLISLSFFPVVWAGEGILTLRECFEKALQQSETLGIREESIRIAEAHYLQALGTVLPHLNVKATETIQDTEGAFSDGEVGRTFTRRSRPEVAVTLKQPLFQGLREFRALKVSSAEKRKNAFERDRAKQLLFFDVARAYYTVLELEEERRILHSIRGTFLKRIEELKERIRLGKSRESEILTTESQLASLEAEIERVRGSVKTAREMLGFLIGEEAAAKLADEFRVPASVKPLESYIASLSSRPDLTASHEAVRFAQGRLSYEKGGRLPTVDLEANYYPYRVGFLSDIDWDLLFTLNIPIFQGGATRGRIREAEALLKQSELSRQEGGRRAETDLRQAYHDLATARSREAALRRAEAKAAANYRAQSEEYRLGLVNNLEVLQALRDWQDRRREANLGRYETKLTYLQLLMTSGELTTEDPR